MTRQTTITLSPDVSSFSVMPKRVRLYLVGYLDGLLRFQSKGLVSNNESNSFPFPEKSPIT